MVQHVGLDDAVHEIAADKAEFAINRGSRATAEVPGVRLVVGKGGIGVLEVCDPNYCVSLARYTQHDRKYKAYPASC